MPTKICLVISKKVYIIIAIQTFKMKILFMTSHYSLVYFLCFWFITIIFWINGVCEVLSFNDTEEDLINVK